MKKIITGSLLTVIISNNITYADDTNNSIDSPYNINNEILNQNKENTTISEIEVNDYNSLKESLSKSNIKINIANNIQITEPISVTGSNILINGQGHILDLNETDPSNKKNKFVIKSQNVEIENLKFENYISSAISIYKANNIYLKDISLLGNDKNLPTDKQSLVGIDLDNSTVKLKNITSQNHRYSSIRLRKESTVELEGKNTHTDDKEEIQSVVLDGAKDNIIKDNTNQYTEIRESIDNNNTKNIYYNTRKVIEVEDFEGLKNALLISNSTININKDIVFTQDLNITNKNIIINGNDKNLDLNNYKFTIKADNTTLKNLQIYDYVSNGLNIYKASNVNISSVLLKGNDLSLPNENRSKVGIDICDSTVSLGNITTSNHLYKGIQIRSGSTVDILQKNNHTNDTIQMQSIKSEAEKDNKVNDINNYYISGSEKVNDGKTTLDYFSKVVKNISTPKELIDSLTSGANVLYLDNDIKFESSDILPDTDLLELISNSNVTIEGNGNTIDLNNIATITLKGNDIVLKNLNIKNAKTIGINIYNCRDTVLDNVNVSNSKTYGIFVNGSTVKLKNCSTSNNAEGGIMITRAISLIGNGYIDSKVEVIGSIKHEEPNINVEIKNVEMTDGYFQDNEFIAPDNIYNKYEDDVEYKVLSDYYLDLFNIVGDKRNKKYKEQSIDYMVIQKVINVKENNVVLNEDGTPIRLVGNGIVDETQNIQKLIEYAASHGIELYFPKGTYKITKDLELSKINLPAQSNFTISGDKEGLTIIDGSGADRMLEIKNEDAKSKMNYVNINNLVFNNVGIELNGQYKKGISLNNNTFVNGKYTKEVDNSGNVTKATMEPYILVKNSKYSIENNIFLRNKNNPGRGIATYKTKNTTIKNNYFGNLEGIADAKEMLPKEVINRLNLIKNNSQELNLSGSQGNFFTAINNERYDENIEICNNYFNMDKSRNITSDFGEDVSITGINVSKDGQRRDHIIYSKGYDGLNIYGNYFKGMENGAAGGLKIRNGKNAYIGSNHFDDVPLLTYIYGDLTKAETLLYDTTIYNNLFHCKTNFGQEGTGILYYQNFKDGDNLEFSDTDQWDNAFGDVKNFIIYKNQFLSDDKDKITISNRAKTAYNNEEFLAYGNKYLDNGEIVNYDKSNLELSEADESELISRLNNVYNKYKNIDIPLTPAKADYTYINELIYEANLFCEYVKNNDLIGNKDGQCPQMLVDKLKSLIDDTQSLINSQTLSQFETNKRITLLQDYLNKLKENINIDTESKPSIPEVDNDTTSKPEVEENKPSTPEVDDNTSSNIESNKSPVINAKDIVLKVGDKFNPLKDVTAFDYEDGDITNKITVEGMVNTNNPGEYSIVYRVSDKDNNTTELIRKILVYKNKVNTQAPKTGDENIFIWLATGALAFMGAVLLNKKKSRK